MQNDDGAVAGELAIELDHIRPELDRSQKRSSRVFRTMPRRSAMSDAENGSTLRHAGTVTENPVESEPVVWHKSCVNRWIEVAVTIPADAADAVSHHLIEIGAPGTIEEDRAGECRRIRAHFPSSVDASSLSRRLRSVLCELEADFPGCASASLDLASIDEEDWAESWKQGFPPIEIGRSLRIRPPWVPCTSGRHDIEIQPAMAFGTGHHASTVGCLVALEDLFGREGPFSPVLDLGTGSGVLAIAAARLGAREVVALDIDAVATEAAQENVRRNGLADVIHVQQGPASDVTGRYSLMLANLYSGLLRSLFPHLSEIGLPGSWLIVAGLLDVDRPAVSDAASSSGWQAVEARARDGWSTLLLRKQEFPSSSSPLKKSASTGC